MHLQIRSVFLAAAATVAGLASTGLVGAIPAVAASAGPRSAIKTVVDTDFAGYVTAGPWRFRYVAATVPVAKCRPQSAQNAAARIALKSTLTAVAHIDLSCGGGRGSVRFGAVLQAHDRFRLAPRVGDLLEISIYRDRAACSDQFAVTNTDTGNGQTIMVRTPCKVVYRHAALGASLLSSGGFTPPPSKVRLWEIRSLVVTSYDGTRGTPCGPWPAEKHLAAPVIAVRMFPSALSNGCRNFSVLLKGRSDAD